MSAIIGELNRELLRRRDNYFFDQYPMFIPWQPAQKALRDYLLSDGQSSCIRTLHVAKGFFALLGTEFFLCTIIASAELLDSTIENDSIASSLAITKFKVMGCMGAASILLYKTCDYLKDCLEENELNEVQSVV